MKKFISMLAGVVMASSLFAVSAYAAGNVTFTADKEEYKVGDEVRITVDSLAKNISTDGFNVKFDTTKFECVDILDDAGYSIKGEGMDAIYLTLQYQAGRNTVDVIYSSSTLEEANSTGTVGYYTVQGSAQNLIAKPGFSTIVFKALAAADAAEFTLNENSAGGNKYNGLCDTLTVAVKGDEPVTPPAPVVTWKEADASWVAPEGKKAIWWPFDYEAGAFPGHVFVEVTDGARTETIGIGANADYDVNGAVSFAVAVILGADVDATNFDCVVK